MVKFRIDDREFRRTLGRYLEENRRDRAKLINEKAWRIARAAAKYTRRASYQKIADYFGLQLKRVSKGRRAGSLTMGRKAKFSDNTGQGISLAELVVITRLRKKGHVALDREDIRARAQRMLGGIARSIGWLAAGWIPSIKRLGAVIGKNSLYLDKQLKNFSGNRKLGYAIPAVNSSKTVAVIVNQSGVTEENKRALLQFGTPALSRAFAEQTADMRDYIERKMKAAARRTGIVTR